MVVNVSKILSFYFNTKKVTATYFFNVANYLQC